MPCPTEIDPIVIQIRQSRKRESLILLKVKAWVHPQEGTNDLYFWQYIIKSFLLIIGWLRSIFLINKKF